MSDAPLSGANVAQRLRELTQQTGLNRPQVTVDQLSQSLQHDQSAVELWSEIEQERTQRDSIQDRYNGNAKRLQDLTTAINNVLADPNFTGYSPGYAQMLSDQAMLQLALRNDDTRLDIMNRDMARLAANLQAEGVAYDMKNGHLTADQGGKDVSPQDIFKWILARMTATYGDAADHAKEQHKQQLQHRGHKALHGLMDVLARLGQSAADAGERVDEDGTVTVEPQQHNVRAWARTRTAVASESGTQTYEACRPVFVSDSQAHEGDFIKQSTDYASQGGWGLHEAADSAQKRRHPSAEDSAPAFFAMLA